MGKCKRCGMCCQFLDVIVSHGYDEILAEFYKARGLKVVYTDEDKMAVEVPQVCQHFKRVYNWEKQRHENVCSIYEDRPEVCREWVCE